MRYRNIGASGLRISEISLGSYLTFGDRVAERDAVRTIHKAVSLGVNSFDTANVYQNGEAERIMAAALKAFPRASYLISTKAHWPAGPGPNNRGLSRKHVTAQVHESLRRMKLDYIDMFYCHGYDSETPLEETLRALDDLVRRGDILYLGVSNWSAAQITAAVQLAGSRLWSRVIAHQCEYSLLRREAEASLFPVCGPLGVSQVVFSPLAQGILTGKYNRHVPAASRAHHPGVNKFFKGLFTDEALQFARETEEAAAVYGVSLPELALNWVLRQRNVASALVGASSPEQIEQNVQAVSKPVCTELLQTLENRRNL